MHKFALTLVLWCETRLMTIDEASQALADRSLTERLRSTLTASFVD